MPNESCFAENQLKDYALGVLDDDSSVQIERHLTVCEKCDSTVATFDGSADSLMRSLRLKPEHADAPSWIERLATHPEPDSVSNPPVGDVEPQPVDPLVVGCLLYTSDAADE